MSIFQGTIDKYVQDQLKAREIIISQGQYSSKNGNQVTPYGSVPRGDAFLRYTTGKNSWVRMSSFVNVDKKIGSKTYSGDELAKKYILEGGVLFQNPNTGLFDLRKGVGKQSSVYGSNIDIGGTRPLGYRPMPGITSINVVNKSAYGSLREATVKFYCWDKHQLEELELLYMRTGYSVLLEWGWSQYLKSGTFTTTNGTSSYSPNLDNISIKNFDSPAINVFNIPTVKELSPDEVIYRQIESLNQQTYGNCDGMLGYIKNFSWQLMPNGGYDCSTILISRGEVISTIKVSSNSNVTNLTDGKPDVPTLSQFEQILLNYSAVVNGSETKSGGQFAYIPPADPNNPSSGNPLSNQITTSTIEKFKKDLKNLSSKVLLYDDRGALYNSLLETDINFPDNNYGGCTLLTAGTTYESGGYGIEYIRMDMFIALLNLFFNFKDENNKLIADIRIPKENVCLASVDTVTVDPTTCIIKNTLAKDILLDPNGGGFDPKVVLGDYDPTTGNVKTVVIREFLTKNKNRGYIKNIYLAVPKLIEIYRSKMQNSSDVIITEYLKDVLNQVSRALGGINNFQLHTTKSASQIIDVKYLEEGGKKQNKYEFDLIGLKSICRDVKIQSRIFESQSTMIAIAAQSSQNVGDLYSSTQVYLNNGLSDRLIKEKGVYTGVTQQQVTEQIYESIVNLGYYLRTKILADPSLTSTFITPAAPTPISGSAPTGSAPTGSTPSTPTAVAPTNINRIVIPKLEEISNAVSTLKTYLYQIRGYDLQYKAIIPFELEITLDGIAGLIQGQIFTINENILPAAYADSDIGFIITGISHSLQNNDWVTVIKTQICVLDSDNKKRVQPAVSIKTLQKIKQQNQEGAYIIFAIADYLTSLYLAAVDIDYPKEIVVPDTYVRPPGSTSPVKIPGYKKPATEFHGVMNTIRTGNLSDFKTYLNYWHKEELAKIGTATASSIGFPTTVSKLLNPSGNAADAFNTEWVDALVYDSFGQDIAIPVGTTVFDPPTNGKIVYRNYSFLGRKDPRTAVPISATAVAPGGSEITALGVAKKEDLNRLIWNEKTDFPNSSNFLYYIIESYKDIVENIKYFPKTTQFGKLRLPPTYNGIVMTDLSPATVMSLGGVPESTLTHKIDSQALYDNIKSYLVLIMSNNQRLPTYSKPDIGYPIGALSKIVPISVDNSTPDSKYKNVGPVTKIFY